MAEVMEAVHLRPVVFGRMELGAPWRLRMPARDYLTFYVVARGEARLELPDAPPVHGSIALAQGDAVLLPRVATHVLRSGGAAQAPPREFDYDGCPRVPAGQAGRFGGDGEVTEIVTGHFTLGAARRNVLMDTLPPAIHLPAGSGRVSAPLAGVIALIVGESAAPGPGSPIVLGRLADLLFVHAIRHWITTGGAAQCGVRAVADPAIGAALRLMHGRYAEPWTLERLASAVAMSRSAFAARFAELVGEPPMQYLAEWRMTHAARLLREGASVAAVAEQVGYANVAAFSKAFARVRGMGPGAWRRAHRHDGAEDGAAHLAPAAA
ncbi:MAG TPA: AraC family transcriptional regulator [Longimicrobium sp.]|nr:AraC family transcriptional regulator [Longimicrobium sp.]